MAKVLQNVNSHAFAKAKMQVAQGSRKLRETLQKTYRRENLRESRICTCVGKPLARVDTSHCRSLDTRSPFHAR